MNIASVQITIIGPSRDVLTAHREAIDSALRQLPFIAVATFFDEGGKLCVDVKYDADDAELDDQLPFLVTDTVQGAIPPETDEPSEAQTFADSTLGEFFWDDAILSWVGELDLPVFDEPRPLSFVSDDPTIPSDAVLARGREIAANFADCEREWKEIAVRELFDVFNKNWNDGEKLTADEFRGSLSFSSLSIEQNGGLTAVYWAGDLFLEHDIEVRIDSDGVALAGLIG